MPNNLRRICNNRIPRQNGRDLESDKFCPSKSVNSKSACGILRLCEGSPRIPLFLSSIHDWASLRNFRPKLTCGSPQSLAGDWKYVLNAPLEMMLHLTVDANGTMTGSIDTPDTPPKHMELTNVHLAGNVLTYTMPPLGTIREVVMADGKKWQGPICGNV